MKIAYHLIKGILVELREIINFLNFFMLQLVVSSSRNCQTSSTSENFNPLFFGERHLGQINGSDKLLNEDN
eukprot:11098636-Ditylum_brightwellii.AAC.1